MFFCGKSLYRQSVQAIFKLIAQTGINHTMACYFIHALKTIGNNIQLKVGVAGPVITGMAFVLMA